MSLRTTLNNNPSLIALGTIVLIGVAVAIGWYAMPDSGGGISGGSAYYTTDDGQTWKSGDANAISPITIDGKEADRVHIYQCEGGKPFAGYMERYKPEYKQVLEQAKVDANSIPMEKRGLYMSANLSGKEIKIVGEKDWKPMPPVPPTIKCPDGKPANRKD